MVKHSLSEIDAMRARGEDKTRSDAPEAESLGKDFWKSVLGAAQERAYGEASFRASIGWKQAFKPCELSTVRA
jgi:hypothetical protein